MFLSIYSAFGVEALGFGIKSNRVVPCIKIYTKVPAELHPSVLADAAIHVKKAVEFHEAGLQLNLEDYINFMEADDYNRAIFHPEELLSKPGEPFDVNTGASYGTISYYMKTDLVLHNRFGDQLSYTKHFGITCAHCTIPVCDTSSFKHRIKPPDMEEIYKNYPLDDLYDSMWHHSEYPLCDHSECHQKNYPLVFTNLQYDCDYHMIKGSTCHHSFGNVTNQDLEFESPRDDEMNTPDCIYRYVCSKYGMIPKYYHLPLPRCIFEFGKNSTNYHLPCNVDIGVLEVKGNPSNITSLDNSHHLQNAYQTVRTDQSSQLSIDHLPHNKYKPSYRKPFQGDYKHVMIHKSVHRKNKIVKNLAMQFHHSLRTKQTAPEGTSTDYLHDMNTPQIPPVYERSVSNDSTDSIELSIPPFPVLNRTDHSFRSPVSPNPQPLDDYQIRGNEYTQQFGYPHKETLQENTMADFKNIVTATSRYIFGKKEAEHLCLHVLSHQIKDKGSSTRTLVVRNRDFCLEIVHKNPKVKQQQRSFPAIKWKGVDGNNSINGNDFIRPGDSGAPLFVIQKNENGENEMVLLGTVCSTIAATRVDFTQEVLFPDILIYMNSQLKGNESWKRGSSVPVIREFESLCTSVDESVSIDKQLEKLRLCKTMAERKTMICEEIKSYCRKMRHIRDGGYGVCYNTPDSSKSAYGLVSFQMTPCIDACSTAMDVEPVIIQGSSLD